MLFAITHIIHLDEKWFYMTKATKKVYQSPNETTKIRRCSNKRFIRKVMFIVAVSQPRHNYNKHVMFDGKLGCWTLTEFMPWKRNIKNRPKGTIVTTPVTSVVMSYISQVTEHTINVWFVRLESYSTINLSNKLHYKHVIY